MTKRIFAAFAAAIGALFLAGSASAQTYSGDTSTLGGVTGSYHIVLTQSNATTFQVTSIYGNSGSQTPSAPISSIKVQFYNSLNPVNSIGVQSNGAAGTNAAKNNWNSLIGGPGGPSFPSTFAVFNTQQTYGMNAYPGGPNLSNIHSDPNGVFSQSGFIVLNPTPTPARSVLFTLTDANNHAYSFYDYVNTPETGSILLLTAALLPLAFVLRRRRTKTMTD